MLIRGIRGGFIGHEFHENDHRHLDVIGLKYNFSQFLRPRCLSSPFNCTRFYLPASRVGELLEITKKLLSDRLRGLSVLIALRDWLARATGRSGKGITEIIINRNR